MPQVIQNEIDIFIDELKKQFDKKFTFAKNNSHPLYIWLNDPVLHAGFQAALIKARVPEQLFFLEQINRYMLQLISYKKAVKKVETIFAEAKEDIQMDELQKIFEEYEKNTADVNLIRANIYLTLEQIWQSCILDGEFALNMSLSQLSGECGGSGKAAELGKQIAENISKTLDSLSKYEAQKIIKENGRDRATTEFQQKLAKSEEILIKVNQILLDFIYCMITNDGIKQIEDKEKALDACQQNIQKWQNETVHPPLWDKETKDLVQKMNRVGEVIVNECYSYKETKSPLLSPRHRKSHLELPVERPRTNSFSLLSSLKSLVHKKLSSSPPSRVSSICILLTEEEAEKFKQLVYPPTPDELTCYEKFIKSLEFMDNQELKHLIEEALAINETQEFIPQYFG